MGTMSTTFCELHRLPSLDPCNGNCTLPLSKFMITAGHDCTAVHDKMVSVDPTTTVMAFVGFFPHPGEPAGCSHLLHAPALSPVRLGESTPFDGKAHAFCDNVGSGTAPLVEFLEESFESTGVLQAHANWEDFDSGFVNDYAEFSVVLLPGRQTH